MVNANIEIYHDRWNIQKSSDFAPKLILIDKLPDGSINPELSSEVIQNYVAFIYGTNFEFISRQYVIFYYRTFLCQVQER